MFPERIEKQFEFLKEIDKEKNIFRQTYLADGMRKENDAEHAWHMALFVMVLSEYANEDIDVLKTMKIVLIHDLIEIYAGDTYAYDSKGNESKRGRELAAADRLLIFCQKTRQRNSGHCGMNSRKILRRKPGLPTQWTRFSL